MIIVLHTDALGEKAMKFAKILKPILAAGIEFS